VDYKAMSLSPVFERYCELAVQLQRVELLSLTREEKLAFFINTYNALVIHGNVRMGAPTNMWQRYKVRAPSRIVERQQVVVCLAVVLLCSCVFAVL
jgi:hypothetical protein